VFSSPTATVEVVGNTGNPSSEKAGVGGSTPSLATTFSITCKLAAQKRGFEKTPLSQPRDLTFPEVSALRWRETRREITVAQIQLRAPPTFCRGAA